MRLEDQRTFALGDAVLIVGTGHDGKVGTIIRVDREKGYLVALEDGTESVFSAEELSLRQ